MTDKVKKTRKPKKEMPAWQRIANDVSRSVDANLRGKLDIEDAQEMLLEALESLPEGKERREFLLANVPELADMKQRADNRQGEINKLKKQVRKLMITIKFLMTFLVKKGHNVLEAFQKSAADDAPRVMAEAREAMFQAQIFEEGASGFGEVLASIETFTRTAVTNVGVEDFMSALEANED